MGAVCNDVCAGELWSPEERRLHTNRLELLVGLFAAVFHEGHACTSPGGQQHCLFLMGDPLTQFDEVSLPLGVFRGA